MCEFLYPPTSTSPHLNYLRNCTVSEVIRWADAVCVSGCTTLVELSVSQRERERESTASKVPAMETINAKLIKVDKTIYAISKHTRYQ